MRPSPNSKDPRQQVYDRERIHWNTAWIKKFGHHFEVVVDPDGAAGYKRSGGKGDLREVLKSEHVFSDAKKGEIAAEEHLVEAFGTSEPLDVARVLVLEGELQLSAEYRAQLREERRKRILTLIHTYAIDPTTGLPHPMRRIELALEEAKVKVDDAKDAESQVGDIVRKLQPIIPIRLETVTLQIHLPVPYGQKLYGDLQRYGTLKRTEWLGDGSLLAAVELPAGLQAELLDELNKKTHGAADAKKIDENKVQFS